MRKIIIALLIALCALIPTQAHADWKHSIWAHPDELQQWTQLHLHNVHRAPKSAPTPVRHARAPSSDAPTQRPARGSVMLTTMYCDYGVTASGQYVFTGEAAAGYDLPLRSRVSISGMGSYVILDRVGYRPWLHVDVWTSSCGAAIAFGTQYRHVTAY